MPISDAQLMADVQAGRTERFDELVARYQPALLRFARSKLGDAALAEDVVQETFLAVLAARATYDPRFAFSTWLYTILLNLCRRQWRRGQTAADRAATSREVAVDRSIDEADGPLRSVLAAERRELLACLLRELPEAEADALRLRFYSGLTFNEIATAMNSSAIGAKVRVRRGLNRLARRLGRIEAADFCDTDK